MNDREPFPTYRVDGDVVWYDHFLPKFEGKSLIGLINGMSRASTVRILDLGAGDYTFAIDCHRRWPGKVAVTGISRDNFLTPERDQLVSNLGIQAYPIETIEVPQRLPPDFKMAVSVLTNIYDSQTDYVGVMWKMLTDGGVGLLDNLPLSSKVNPVKIEDTLRQEGYQVEIQSLYRSLPNRKTHSEKLISFKPAPDDQRFVYLKEIERLQDEQAKPPSKNIPPDITIAFRKDSRLGNLGSKILELTQGSN